MIGKIFTKGALPVLERGLVMSGRRHEVLASNVANANTPFYVPRDLDVGGFQEAMTRALETRDRKTVPTFRMLPGGPVEEVGGTVVVPEDEEASGQILLHDQNKVSIEKEMVKLTKNALYHNQMAELVRKEFGQLRAALSTRGV